MLKFKKSLFISILVFLVLPTTILFSYEPLFKIFFLVKAMMAKQKTIPMASAFFHGGMEDIRCSETEKAMLEQFGTTKISKVMQCFPYGFGMYAVRYYPYTKTENNQYGMTLFNIYGGEQGRIRYCTDKDNLIIDCVDGDEESNYSYLDSSDHQDWIILKQNMDSTWKIIYHADRYI